MPLSIFSCCAFNVHNMSRFVRHVPYIRHNQSTLLSFPRLPQPLLLQCNRSYAFPFFPLPLPFPVFFTWSIESPWQSERNKIHFQRACNTNSRHVPLSAIFPASFLSFSPSFAVTRTTSPVAFPPVCIRDDFNAFTRLLVQFNPIVEHSFTSLRRTLCILWSIIHNIFRRHNLQFEGRHPRR